MRRRKHEPEVVAYGYIIADREGMAQLQTLRGNASEAWAALLGHKANRSERDRYKKMGFLTVPVFVRNYFSGKGTP